MSLQQWRANGWLKLRTEVVTKLQQKYPTLGIPVANPEDYQ